MKKHFSIAIDGPVGVGKGTLAVALSKKLEAIYIYTGGMYRALALACLRENIDLHDEKKVLEVFDKSSIDLKLSSTGTKVFLNGEEITDEIFLPRVSNAVPITSAFANVRKKMVKMQKKMAEKGSIVMEGRDIATKVVPDADLKIFLTADLKTRAKRRYKQLLERGIESNIDEVIKDTQRRDKLDIEREASPLTVVEDAYVLDTTNLSIEETVDKIIEKLKEKGIA